MTACRLSALLLAIAIGVTGSAAAQDAQPGWMRGLDELMAVEVTSVSRKDQRLADTAAAVFVLTRDDIRRSRMRTVADVLRLVPGLHVAQVDGNKWAVSARGMNGRYASKLLVLVDGRSLYTPYHAGVAWDAVDIPVHAIERIEIIRGPGASIWGVNAVNGVINIITTAAVTVRETVLSAGFGAADFGTVLHSARLGDRIGYRLFADVGGHDALGRSGGGSAGDDWRQQWFGGSLTATLNGGDRIEASLRAAGSQSHSLHPTVADLVPFTVVHLPMTTDADVWSGSARWTRQLRNQGRIQVEGFVDEWWRTDDLDHHRRTYDIGLQHRIGIIGRHDVIWGAGYRLTDETTVGTPSLEIAPAEYRHHLVSAFVQDEIAVAGRRGHATLGTRIERHAFTGWTTQPTARFHWRFTPTQSAWGAVSRALRSPDRLERSVRYPLEGMSLPGGLPGVVFVEGSADARAEALTAYEAGYRAALGTAATLDLAAYYNRYTGLRSVVQGPSRIAFDAQGTPFLHLPLVLSNVVDATTVGGEAIVTYAPRSFWRVTAGYTLFTIAADVPGDLPAGGFEGGSAPRHQGQLRASATLPRAIEADLTVIAAGAIPDLGTGVPAWTRVDAGIGWRPRQPLELSLAVQNILDSRHQEFGGRTSTVSQFGEMSRTAWAGVTWRF